MSLRKSFLPLLLWCMAVAGGPQPTGSPALLAFVGARLIDGTAGPGIDRATLVVRGGRIEAVGPATTVRPPGGARIIDLAGKVDHARARSRRTCTSRT